MANTPAPESSREAAATLDLPPTQTGFAAANDTRFFAEGFGEEPARRLGEHREGLKHLLRPMAISTTAPA